MAEDALLTIDNLETHFHIGRRVVMETTSASPYHLIDGGGEEGISP